MATAKKAATKKTTKTTKTTKSGEPASITEQLAHARLLPMTQFTPDMPLTVAGIAQVVHEANRALCAAMGDHSQLPWDKAPQWQRDSAIAGVEAVLTGKITTPEQSHESWMKHKKADGWKHGAKKDEVAKTHPAMLSFPHLPIPQQIKDYVFHAIVTGILGFLAQKYPQIAPFIADGAPATGTQSPTNPAK